MKSILTISLVWLAGWLAFSFNVAIEVNGTITDISGSPMAGAIVTEKNSRNATVSDNNGNFRIKVYKKDAVLQFSAVGYEMQEVALKGTTTLTVQMIPLQTVLEDVVVMGYGTQKKSLITGTTTNELHSPNLRGRVAGVSVRGNHQRAPMRQKDKYEHKDLAYNTEEYDAITENGFLTATENPLSTFSIDVDAASYSNVRRYINQGLLPPAGAVRIEEMINYFRYDYPKTSGSKHPFSVHTELGAAPWNPDHQLAMIHLQATAIETAQLPASNLVFLIDVSGSMMEYNKLPLVKQSLFLLTDQLREKDRVAIVVYAGGAGLVLPSTNGSNKQAIRDAIDRLVAGGSTAGGAGIKLAYTVAREHFVTGGNNRVILCTDGDFNVGASSDADMEHLIEQERKSRVYLTVLGYGMGNYKDSKMQKLADKGNGHHAYIDNLLEAKKVLVQEFGGTLFTVAKDVKLQVEFNPQTVQAYRLIGYENHMLNKEDFNDDLKDAGELGSGHTVTALYEIIPVGVNSKFIKTIDPLKYQGNNKKETSHYSNELFTVKFRYKQPDSETSQLAEQLVLQNSNRSENSIDFRFASAVAEFGLLLSDSKFKQSASFGKLLERAEASLGKDTEGYRKEFLQLVQKAGQLANAKNKTTVSDWAGFK